MRRFFPVCSSKILSLALINHPGPGFSTDPVMRLKRGHADQPRVGHRHTVASTPKGEEGGSPLENRSAKETGSEC